MYQILWGHSSQASWTTTSQCWCLLLGRYVFKHSLTSYEHLRRGESETLLIRGKNTRRTIASWVSLTIHKARHGCSTLCPMHSRVRMHRGTYMATVCIWLWMDMLIFSLHKMDPMFIAKKNMQCDAPIRKKLALVRQCVATGYKIMVTDQFVFAAVMQMYFSSSWS